MGIVKRLIVVGVVIVALITGCTTYVQSDNALHTRVTTICLAQRTATSGGGEYRIYTSDTGTYALTDSWLGFSRHNSADTFFRLSEQLPGTFRITYNHHRWGPKSWFPNIDKFQRIAPNRRAIAACGDYAQG
jgi:hypothetical protein